MRLLSFLREKIVPHQEKRDRWETAIRWLLLVAIFLLPIFFLAPTSYPLEFNKVLLFDILVLVSALIFLLRALVKRQITLIRTRLEWPLLAFLLFFLVSFVFSKNHYMSLVGVSGYYSGGVVSVICFILFFYLLIHTVKTVKDVWWFIGALLSSAALVIIYNLFQVNQIFLLPWSVTKNENFNLVASSSATLAAFVAVAFVLSFGIFLYVVKKWQKLMSGIFILASLALLFFLDKDTAFYTLALGLFAFLILVTFKSKQLSNWWVVLPTVLLTIIVLFIFIDASSLTSVKVSESVTPDQKTSAVVSWQSFLKAPLWGSGPQTFTLDFIRYRPESFNDTSLWNLRFTKAANEWFGFLATVGLGGVLALLVVSLWFLWRGARLVIQSSRVGEQWTLTIVVWVTFFMIFLVSFLLPFNFVLYFLWWLLLALGYRLVTLTQSSEKQYSLKKPSLALTVTIIFTLVTVGVASVVFFGVKVWLADYYFVKAQGGIEQKQEFSAIEKHLEQAIAYNRYETKYYATLAQGYATQAQLEAARTGASATTLQQLTQKVIDTLKKAKEVDANNPAVYEQEAALYDSMRNLVSNVDELSVKAYTNVSELEPTNPLARLNLGRSQLLWAQRLLSATEDEPAKVRAYDLVDQALVNFGRARTLKKDFILADINMALAYETRGETNKAIEQLERLATQYPNSTDLLSALASLYQKKEQYDKALSLYQQVIQLAPDDSNAHWQLALIYEKQGKIDEAISELETVQRLLPDNTQVTDKLSQLKELQKNPKK